MRKDGSQFWGNVVLTALHDAQKELIGFTKVTRDLTDSKLKEESLIKSEQRFRQLLEAVPDSMIIVNAKNEIELTTSQTEIHFGYNKNELKGKKIEMLLPDAHLISHKVFSNIELKDGIASVKKEAIELQGRRKDGSLFPVEVTLSVIDGEEGLMIISAIRDITEKKKKEVNIIKLNDELEQKVKQRTTELEKIRSHLEEEVSKRTLEIKMSNQELEAFSYSVSHDLRAPLRAIAGYSTILQEDYLGQVDEEGQRVIQIIIRNVTRMQKLIDDMLRFSRLTRQEISMSSINMKALFKEAYQRLLQAEPATRDIEFKISDIPDTKGDHAMISQMITNLVSNALKYTRLRKKAVIEVGSKTVDNMNIYFIKDNGVGFDEHYKDKLFEVFQRLHKDAEFEGTGVGLAIVQRVIFKHGGQVWGESSQGEGATFYFTLP